MLCDDESLGGVEGLEAGPNAVVGPVGSLNDFFWALRANQVELVREVVHSKYA